MAEKTRFLTLAILCGLLGILAGCSDDDNPTAVISGPKTFTITIENIAAAGTFFGSGVFNTPVGAAAPAAIGPGESYEVNFGALPGHRLSFATMMVQSNDLFYAPDGDGIELFNGTTPVSGDVTDQIMLWDAGSEANEEPGLGPNQAPRQSAANTGAPDADNTVRPVNDGFTYPAVSAVLQATLTPHDGGQFTLRLTNVSTSATLTPSSGPSLAVPLAPGVFVVHVAPNPLYTSGGAATGNGLEALAEDGNPAILAAQLAAETSLASPLAPGVYALHAAGHPLYTTGLPDGNTGLESLAEDGDPSVLNATLAGNSEVSASGVFSIPVGQSGAGPLVPGHSYQFTVTGEPGDRLSFATMFVESNDLFFGPGDEGLALFDNSGAALSGDITDQIMLWDAGTEINQWPGAGMDQPLRQMAPNAGADDADNTVRLVNDGFPYPATNAAIRVTVSTE